VVLERCGVPHKLPRPAPQRLQAIRCCRLGCEAHKRRQAFEKRALERRFKHVTDIDIVSRTLLDKISKFAEEKDKLVPIGLRLWGLSKSEKIHWGRGATIKSMCSTDCPACGCGQFRLGQKMELWIISRGSKRRVWTMSRRREIVRKSAPPAFVGEGFLRNAVIVFDMLFYKVPPIPPNP
jgi:hypothetical protein